VGAEMQMPMSGARAGAGAGGGQEAQKLEAGGATHRTHSEQAGAAAAAGSQIAGRGFQLCGPLPVEV
jgi:hypothetical protein